MSFIKSQSPAKQLSLINLLGCSKDDTADIINSLQDQRPENIFKKLQEECYFSGIEHKDNGQIKQAINCFRKSLQYNTNFVPSLMELAIIYEECNDFSRADKLYKRCLTLYPENYDLLIHYASCLIKQQKLLRAFKYLRKAEQLEPDLPIAFYFRYCAYFYNVGKPKHALLALKVLREHHQDFLPVYYTIGEIHQYMGNITLAAIWYRRVLRINPSCKEALLALSSIYCNNFQDREKAIYYSSLLLNLEPQNHSAQICLALARNLPQDKDKKRDIVYYSNSASNLFNVSPLDGKNANHMIYSFFSNR